MITYEKALEIIEFQRKQIEDLTAERDRLRGESENASDALAWSQGTNAELSAENNDMRTALEMLGIGGEDSDMDGTSGSNEAGDA